jgi:two-component system OmpR family sensor kinase
VDRETDDMAVRFLSLASHELRGPLATVRTYADLLRSPRFALDARVRAAVEVMLRNVDRALGSWELLAEAWRLDVDGLRLDLRDEDLLPALRASAEAAASVARERGVRLEASLPAALEKVRVDPDRLQLVLSGAWAHVLERTHPGASAGLTVREDPAGCTLTFWDPGPPLTPEDESRAFDHRWQALREHALGPAFRMAVAGALVQAHGGTATVGSLSGRTLFALAFPRAGRPTEVETSL